MECEVHFLKRQDVHNRRAGSLKAREDEFVIAHLGGEINGAAGIHDVAKLIEDGDDKRLLRTDRHGHFCGCHLRCSCHLGLHDDDRERRRAATNRAGLREETIVGVCLLLRRGGDDCSVEVIRRCGEGGCLPLLKDSVGRRECYCKDCFRVAGQRSSICLQFIERSAILRSALEPCQSDISSASRAYLLPLPKGKGDSFYTAGRGVYSAMPCSAVRRECEFVFGRKSCLPTQD